MNLKYCLAIIITLCIIHVTTGQDCSPKGMRRFDQQVARLMTIANSGRKFPESKGRELKGWCE